MIPLPAWLVVLVPAALMLSGCDGAMDPRGSRAESVAGLWWGMLIIASLVSLLVTVAVVVAVVSGRRRDGRPEMADAPTREEPSRGMWAMVVGGGVVLPAVVIPALLVWSFVVDRGVLAEEPESLTIEVHGHQFWWEVSYPELDVVTANEIYIPAGEPVTVHLTSNDVIHSFWVPQLGGKADLIPGRTNEFVIEADEPGRYRGQCAEFCGIQHANMRVIVFALSADDFDAWAEEQRASATNIDGDELAQQGRAVFMESCASCHAVRGHDATGHIGPDLTHLQSRERLAAGTLPNNRGNLAGWILQPQNAKPGARMPTTTMSSEELDALLHYLEQLD